MRRNQRANTIITQHYHRVLKQILPKIPKALLIQTVDSWLDSKAILVPDIDIKTYNQASQTDDLKDTFSVGVQAVRNYKTKMCQTEVTNPKVDPTYNRNLMLIDPR